MDNLNIKLHDFQKLLLKKLSAHPSLRFNDLLIENLESEHMNYHLQKLAELGFVNKSAGKYHLTDKGKDYSGMMDDEVEFIEKQPKTSVLLHIVRKNGAGEVESLVSKRLRHPYYGKIGRLTGKVRFGETLQQAAERELFEETGLTAKTIVLEEVYHKMRHQADGTFVQDNLFYKFFIKDLEGTLIERTPHQENLWLTTSDVRDNPDLDLFDTVWITDRFEPDALKFTEDVGLAEGY